MYEKKKKAVVPRLRFPEFRDAGEWEVRRLGTLITTITPPKKIQTTEYQPSGRFPIIDQSSSDICGWTDDESALAKADFPVVIFGDHSCVVKLANSPFAQGADGIKILSPANEIEARFLFQSLLGNPIEQRGYKRHFSTLKEKLIPYPRKETGEQQKIADCLASLDDLIRAGEAQLVALKDHKKGLMQQLFPREGETTPRLRFPEFRDAGEWEVCAIEEMAERIAQGGTPKTSVAGYWKGEIPWITPAEMGDDAAHHYTERTLRTISVEGLQSSSAELLPVNSVIVSSRAPIGYVTINKVEMAANQGCKGIVPKAEVYHEFLYFSLLVANQLLNDLGAGAGFKEISASTLKTFLIPVPEYSEQQKIADCLASLDDLIRARAARIEALKSYKRGLMQQLFPSIDGVRG